MRRSFASIGCLLFLVTGCTNSGGGYRPGGGPLDGGGGGCGAVGQGCCNGSACNNGLTCQNGSCVAPTCGAAGQACCAGSVCDGALTCQAGTCQANAKCGALGQACCANASCNNGLTCQAATCAAAVACGALNQACCANASCDNGLVCQGAVCRMQALGNGVTGESCTRNVDCQSDLCVPVGGGRNVCTSACTTAGNCISGWSCGPVTGMTGNICQCTTSIEVCDGRDNDCDAVVDNGAAPDADCQARLGPAYACRSGSCQCVNPCFGQCNVDFNSDPDNCGGCGNVCSVAHATAGCSGGRCTVAFCDTGWDNCDGIASNGCESDALSDNDNCGFCGNVCFTPNNMSCQNGSCAAQTFSHDDGFGDTWSDNNPLGTYTLAEAQQACFAYARTHAGGSGCGTLATCCNSTNMKCVYLGAMFGGYLMFWAYTWYPGLVFDSGCAGVASWQ